MKKLDMDFLKIIDTIKNENKKIVVFGAGVIASAVLPYYIDKFDLENNLSFCVDNSLDKQGKSLFFYSRKIEIKSAAELTYLDGKNIIIIITSSFFSEIIKQLDSIESLKEACYFVFPEILIRLNSKSNYEIKPVYTSEKLIPSVIHYIWLGEKKMPENLSLCIDSWKKFCPEYEIICWNEKNYDFSKNKYMKQAYDMKKWAFVSDYARLDILNEYGGIYMDTDVELLRSPDDMLYQKAFCSVEKWNVVNTGGCCGSIKGSLGIKAMLDFRNKFNFINEDGSLNSTASGYYETVSMINEGYKPNGTFQKVLDMNIYPYDFFHPYDYMSGKTDLTNNTISIHHFNGGWVDKKIMNIRKGVEGECLFN